MPARWILALVMAGLLWSPAGRSEVRRMALVVGHNVGASHETVLRYAERDARRVAGLLEELGQFDQVHLVVGPTAGALAERLEHLRQTIRGQKEAGDQVMFLFFYSGHADDQALHLGGSQLTTEEVLSRLAGIGADLRVAIFDACQAGALTREKGLTLGPPVRVELHDELEATGQVVIASTGRSESAQESEALQGSFFTAHLVSGLRGAADSDGDGRVGIREAYAYAYDRTIRSTVVSAAGIQHPTYRVELAGQRDLTLTWPDQSESFLGFRARSPGTFLVLAGEEELVVAEVPARDRQELRIGLKAGSYVVKKRSAEGLQVARVRLTPGSDAVLDESQMQRVPYAVLARKGGLSPGWLTAMVGLSSPVLSVEALAGLELGYVFDLEWLALWPVVGLEYGIGSSDGLDVQLLVLEPALGAVYLFRFARWNLFLGLEASLPIHFQMIDGQKRRDSLGFGLDGMFGASWWLTESFGLTSRLQVGARWLNLTGDGYGGEDSRWSDRISASFQLGLRVRL